MVARSMADINDSDLIASISVYFISACLVTYRPLLRWFGQWRMFRINRSHETSQSPQRASSSALEKSELGPGHNANAGGHPWTTSERYSIDGLDRDEVWTRIPEQPVQPRRVHIASQALPHAVHVSVDNNLPGHIEADISQSPSRGVR
jgi:hypothetical protein